MPMRILLWLFAAVFRDRPRLDLVDILDGNRNSSRWRHNGRDSVSNHQPHDCLLNRLFRRRSKKKSKLRVTGFWAGNSPGTGEFSTEMVCNAESVSIWWRHHGYIDFGQSGVIHDPAISQHHEAFWVVKVSGNGEIPESWVAPLWPKSRYQFLFYYGTTKLSKFMEIRCVQAGLCPESCFESATMESTVADHCHSSLLSYTLVAIVT